MQYDSQETVLSIPGQEVRWLRGLLALAVLFFAVGITTPMLTLSKFIVVTSSFSVLSGVLELLLNGQLLLALVIFLFSVALPVAKVLLLFHLLAKNDLQDSKLHRTVHLMHEYGRWAMLDVMVVAVLIVTVKLGAIASVEVHYGLFIFGLAVLLIMLVTHRVVRYTSSVAVKIS